MGDSLLKPENKAQLADILTFHVLPAQVLSTDLKFYQRVATVEGKHLDVIRSQKGVYVGADIKSLKQVTGADNLASNGVAHIIDGVMLPPSDLSADKPNIVELAQSVDDLSTVDTLLKPENKAQLADILTYHVLSAEVKSTDLKFFQKVPTVEGKNLHVFKNGGKVKVGPSSKDLKNVVAADNFASNGVVHIIDGVMLPPSDMIVV